MILVASVFCSFLAISNQSLWIDEAHSAVKAIQPTWNKFVYEFTADAGSDMQMPGYMATLWAWEKLTGPSEYALRMLNAWLFLFSQIIILYCLRAPRPIRIWFAICALLSPFVWYYLDEARPYILQYFASVLVVTSLCNIAFFPSPQKITRDLLYFLTGAIVLCAASLLGVIFAGIYGCIFVVLIWEHWTLFKKVRISGVLVGSLLLSALLLALLGIYYAWTLTQGARASALGNTTVANLIFVFYEFFGLAGLGPDRNLLRSVGPKALLAYAIPLGIALLIYALTILLGIRAAFRSRAFSCKPVLFFIAGSAIMLGGIYLFGVALHFRILGRHFIPLFPLFLLAFAWILASLIRSDRLSGGLVICLLASWLISDVRLRFSGLYAKDDYRTAAGYVKDASPDKNRIWWAADLDAARYYGLNLQNPDTGITSPTLPTISPSKSLISSRERPNLIILSKGDIFDAKGALKDYLQKEDYQLIKTFPGFTIWQEK
ncbi:MAG: hypothetical protein ABI615_01635 [Chthoniobacterales bacterium]